MSKRYRHCFDTRIAVIFESDDDDFTSAFDAWLAQFPDSAAKRAALLDGDEGTKTLIEGVIYNWCEDTQDSKAPFSC